MKTSVNTLQLGIASDLYLAGYTVDGDEYIAEVYFISAEDDLGNRWSNGGWKGAKAGVDEETGEPYFMDAREGAKAAAQRLLNRMYMVGEVDFDFWREDRPAYGSVAYVQYGQADEVAHEKKVG